ncbi:hypothetical protein B566_EDAN004290 [Ephemera danica]|nr:hypothetical protein B566_EDAN004290 [Ephemera danica]
MVIRSVLVLADPSRGAGRGRTVARIPISRREHSQVPQTGGVRCNVGSCWIPSGAPRGPQSWSRRCPFSLQTLNLRNSQIYETILIL